jgi:hypothetical protein
VDCDYWDNRIGKRGLGLVNENMFMWISGLGLLLCDWE